MQAFRGRNSRVNCPACHFIMLRSVLYRRSFEGMLLRCMNKDDAHWVLNEAHSIICNSHFSYYFSSNATQKKILCMGYYWDTMKTDVGDSIH